MAALASMTGFSRESGVLPPDGTHYVWELRSVNGRGLDIRLRLPSGMDALEPALRDAAKRSHVPGDSVENYMKIAPGKLGVTFCVSVELAGESAAR